MEEIILSDLNIKYTTVNTGVYLVDGKDVVEVHTRTKIPFVNTIQEITRTRIVDHYEFEGATLSPTKYNEQIEILLSKCDDDMEFRLLEDEFAYKKFIRDWTAVYISKETISEPISFTKTIEIVTESGNPYITSFFSIGKEVDMFTYNRQKARYDIVQKLMKQFGMEFKSNADYSETKTSKVWYCKSTDSLRFCVGFGTYLFSDEESLYANRNGSLDGLIKLYDEDVLNLTEYISSRYKLCFGAFESDLFNFQEIYLKLDNLITNVRKLRVNKSDTHSQRYVLSELVDIRRSIELAHKE